jgi:hypothetical protein
MMLFSNNILYINQNGYYRQIFYIYAIKPRSHV